MERLTIRDVHPGAAYEELRGVAIPTGLREGACAGESKLLHRTGREIPVSLMLVIPRAVATEGTPQFTLDNLGYNGGPVDPESARGWAVSRMWFAKVTSGPTLPVELDGEAQVLEKLATDVMQDSKDLYRLVTGLRSLTVGFMKVAGQPALLLPLGTGGNADAVVPALKGFRASLEAGETGPALALLGQAVANAENGRRSKNGSTVSGPRINAGSPN